MSKQEGILEGLQERKESQVQEEWVGSTFTSGRKVPVDIYRNPSKSLTLSRDFPKRLRFVADLKTKELFVWRSSLFHIDGVEILKKEGFLKSIPISDSYEIMMEGNLAGILELKSGVFVFSSEPLDVGDSDEYPVVKQNVKNGRYDWLRLYGVDIKSIRDKFDL